VITQAEVKEKGNENSAQDQTADSGNESSSMRRTEGTQITVKGT
jgi:hypothetical protein